jgi:hypothetical protein
VTVDLEPGDVVLVRSSGIIPSLIRFGERVRFMGWPKALMWLAKCVIRIAPADVPADPWYVSHAAVCVGDVLIEAQAQGLQTAPLSKYDQADTVVVRLADLRPDVTPADRARAVLYARGQLAAHDRYGWLSIASIVLQLISPLRLDLSWDGALICSAFAAQCLEHAGVILATRSSLTTMPADLAAMVRPTSSLAAAA